MEEESFFVKLLTPAKTEEVKPGLFIQEKQLGGYRQVHPAAWNGKINWKNLILGPNFWKNFILFAILIFVAYSYQHDTKECFQLMEQWNNDGLVCAKASSFSVVGNNPHLEINKSIINWSNGLSLNNSNSTT